MSNDGGEVISNKPGGAISVQNALAQSSNTAYTDLAHRVGTENIIQMAANMGVNIAAFPAGSGLSQLKGQVGMALGTGSLTVNEQATMLVHDRQRRHVPPGARHQVVAGAGRRGAAAPSRRCTRCSPRPSTRRSSTRWR